MHRMKAVVVIAGTPIVAALVVIMLLLVFGTPGHSGRAIAAWHEIISCDNAITYSGVFVGTDAGSAGDLITGSAFDAQRMAKTLRETCPGGWGNGSQSIIVQTGATDVANSPVATYDDLGASVAKIDGVVAQHQAVRLPDEEFIIYFATHDNYTPALMAMDSGPVMTWGGLRDILIGFKPGVHVTIILDTCNAGVFATAAGDLISVYGSDIVVLMAANSGCQFPEYNPADSEAGLNEEWLNDDVGIVGPGTESCSGGVGTADGDTLNDAADGDCLSGVFTNHLRACLAIGITASEWFSCAHASSLAQGDPLPSMLPAEPVTVGGITSFTASGSNPPADPTQDRGSPASITAAVAGGVAVALAIVLAAGSWYARKRWLGKRA